MSPSSFRDSGIRVTRALSAARGLPASAAGPARISEALTGTAPKIARATSERPAPTSPASPTISPARISSETPWTPGAVRSRTLNAMGASAVGACFGGYVRATERPSIAATSESSVSSAAGPVRTTWPSRRIVTVSASSSTSPRKCETRMTVRPPADRPLTISWKRWISNADSAAVGSSKTMSSASRASARRISTCCCAASGNAPTVAFAGTSKPAPATTRRNRSRSSRRRTKPNRRGSAPRNTFSATVRCGTSETSWATIAIPRSSAARGDPNATGSPRTCSSPWSC